MKEKEWQEIVERLRLYDYKELEQLGRLVEAEKKAKWNTYYAEVGKKYQVNAVKRAKSKQKLKEEVYPKIIKFAIKMPIGSIYKIKGNKVRKLIEVRGETLFGECGRLNKEKQWIGSGYSAENYAGFVEEARIKNKYYSKKDILAL